MEHELVTDQRTYSQYKDELLEDALETQSKRADWSITECINFEYNEFLWLIEQEAPEDAIFLEIAFSIVQLEHNPQFFTSDVKGQLDIADRHFTRESIESGRNRLEESERATFDKDLKAVLEAIDKLKSAL